MKVSQWISQVIQVKINIKYTRENKRSNSNRAITYTKRKKKKKLQEIKMGECSQTSSTLCKMDGLGFFRKGLFIISP